MGWLGLSFFIAMVALAIVHYYQRKPLKEWYCEEYVAGFLVPLFVSMFIIAMVGMFIYFEEGRRNTGDYAGCRSELNSWNLATAVRDQTTSSSFILGTGGSHTIDRYYVYREEPEGFLFTTYYANKTYIIEQAGTPRYERTDWICDMPITNFLWFGHDIEMRNNEKFGRLYVPFDTILREFKM